MSGEPAWVVSPNSMNELYSSPSFCADCVRPPPGERVYMRVGDIFKDADVVDLSEWQAGRRKDGRGTDDGD
jgi:hypothetical protein